MCGINLSLGFRKSQDKVYMTKRDTNALAYGENIGLGEFSLNLIFKKHFQDFILIVNIYVKVGSTVLFWK